MEHTNWEERFNKQYTTGGEWWKEGMAITPSMVKAFISQVEQEAERRERERIIQIVKTNPDPFMVKATEERFIKSLTK